MNEIEEGTNKWKYIFCLWIRRINIAKMSKVLKCIYGVNVILVKILMNFFFIEIENICMDPRKIPQIAKGTRTDLKALHFKLCYKTVIIKKNIVLA